MQTLANLAQWIADAIPYIWAAWMTNKVRKLAKDQTILNQNGHELAKHWRRTERANMYLAEELEQQRKEQRK